MGNILVYCSIIGEKVILQPLKGRILSQPARLGGSSVVLINGSGLYPWSWDYSIIQRYAYESHVLLPVWYSCRNFVVCSFDPFDASQKRCTFHFDTFCLSELVIAALSQLDNCTLSKETLSAYALCACEWFGFDFWCFIYSISPPNGSVDATALRYLENDQLLSPSWHNLPSS